MKLGAHGPNRRTSGPRAQIMRKSIFTAESQFSWNWVLTAQIDAQVVPELRTSEYQFLSPNCNFHEIGCSRPKSTNKRSPSSDHEKINFYGRIANFMKLAAHGPKSTNKRSPSSDHEKINFYGRNAIFMKLGAHGPNRRTSGPRAQIMRKSIFTAESQISWNWVLTAQIDSQALPELRSWENQVLRPNRNSHEIGLSRPKSTHKAVPELRSWENQFLRPKRNFHEIGCSRPKSMHKHLSSGTALWVDLGRDNPISWELRFGRKTWFSHDLSSGSACESIWAVSTQFHEICDSAVKIDFLMIWARGPLVHRFRAWAPNFMKIAFRP